VTRIVAGALGGRRLALPADARVRPTADRVREAWLAITAPALPGARVLDLFAGSGALGFEALSRGARHVTFVEILPASLAAIRKNARALGLADRVKIVRRDALAYLERVRGKAFDIAFADPPFGHGIAARLVERFRRDPFARLLGVEHPATEVLSGDDSRRYGDVSLTFCFAPSPPAS
jgi:16S rRNA (guanine966-N2)-methyltransferase